MRWQIQKTQTKRRAMDERRVVITGMGAVSPAGIGVPNLWEAVRSGTPLGALISKFDVSRNKSRVAAAIPAFDRAARGLSSAESEHWDPTNVYGVMAAAEAITQAGLGGINPERSGVCVGTAVGGVEAMERGYADLVVPERNGDAPPRYPRLNDQDVPQHMLWSYSCNTTGIEIAARWGLRGPVTCVSTGCTAGADAMGYALELLRYGDADLMIVGGVDAPITPICVSAFDVIRALTRNNENPRSASRPFDSKRDGFLLSEAAGFLVLEKLDHAERRGAPILAELVGYGTNCNAFHMTSMHESGEMLAVSIDLALKDAGLSPENIDYINAHGSSTPQNDRAETAGYKSIFGDRAREVPISSTKSVTGHPLGAASTLEAIISVLAIRESWVPPTANLEHSSPECDLDYVPRHGRSKKLRFVLSNASGFGGLHSAVILGSVN